MNGAAGRIQAAKSIPDSIDIGCLDALSYSPPHPSLHRNVGTDLFGTGPPPGLAEPCRRSGRSKYLIQVLSPYIFYLGVFERRSFGRAIKRREGVIRDFGSALATRLSLPSSPPSPAQSQRQNDHYTRSRVQQNAQRANPVSNFNARSPVSPNSQIVALKGHARTRLTHFKNR